MPDINQEDALQMTVKAINDLVRTDGLVPTLFVFEALPRFGLLNNSPSPSTYQRIIALRKATSAMFKHFAARQLRNKLNSRDWANENGIHNALLGAPTLVYRPEKDRWSGVFSLLDVQREDVAVHTLKDAQTFWSPVVKRYLNDDNSTGTDKQVSESQNANIQLLASSQ